MACNSSHVSLTPARPSVSNKMAAGLKKVARLPPACAFGSRPSLKPPHYTHQPVRHVGRLRMAAASPREPSDCTGHGDAGQPEAVFIPAGAPQVLQVEPQPPHAGEDAPEKEPAASAADDQAGNKAHPDPIVQKAFTVRGKLLTHDVKLDLRDGSRLTIRALTEEYMDGTREILCTAFAAALGKGVDTYTAYLEKQIGGYLREHIHLPPLAVVLVATLSYPHAETRPALSGHVAGSGAEDEPPSTDTTETNGPHSSSTQPNGDGDDDRASWPPNETDSESELGVQVKETLVGTLELSFNPATRTRYMTLNPPEDCAYLCNMSIAPTYRRRGYGSMLLEASESFASLANKDNIYLHVRLQDDPAFRLYHASGYEVLKKDSWMLQVAGMDRRYLMMKDLSTPQAQL